MKQWRDFEDLLLVRSVIHGKHGAFDRLLAKYSRRIYNLALRVLGDVQEAEDATQETFVVVYRNLSDFRHGSSLDTWIHRIALNSCLQRKRKRVPEPCETDDDSRIASNVEDPVASAIRTELSGILDAAIRRLPDAQQAVVLLHGMQGFSHSEIAAILECPLGTVKSRLSAAFSTLRSALGDYVRAEPPAVAKAPASPTSEASL